MKGEFFCLSQLKLLYWHGFMETVFRIIGIIVSPSRKPFPSARSDCCKLCAACLRARVQVKEAVILVCLHDLQVKVISL